MYGPPPNLTSARIPLISHAPNLFLITNLVVLLRISRCDWWTTVKVSTSPFLSTLTRDHQQQLLPTTLNMSWSTNSRRISSSAASTADTSSTILNVSEANSPKRLPITSRPGCTVTLTILTQAEAALPCDGSQHDCMSQVSNWMINVS